MKFHPISILASIAISVACSTEPGYDNYPSEATATTLGASEIGFDTAVLSGKAVIKEELQFKYTVGVEYSTDASFPEDNTKSIIASIVNDDYSFSVKASNLDALTQYYYRAYAKKTQPTAIVYGDVKSFSTLNNETSVGVSVSNIGLFSADFHCVLSGVDEEAFLVYKWGTTPESLDKSYGFRYEVGEEDKALYFTPTSLLPSTEYYYSVRLEYRGKEYVSSVESFQTLDIETQGEIVDMGLSVKWRNANVGADSPEQAGGYYAWGEIEEKESYSWGNYKYCDGTQGSINKYTPSQENTYKEGDGLFTLVSTDDVAQQKLGDGWRMPTSQEINELIFDKSISEAHFNYKGQDGILVYNTKGALFFPVTGYKDGNNLVLVDPNSYYGDDRTAICVYYWSGSLFSDNAYHNYEARSLGFGMAIPVGIGGGFQGTSTSERYLGFHIRPVHP